jgi:uncharacterized protein YdbL (DUF1318 family)
MRQNNTIKVLIVCLGILALAGLCQADAIKDRMRDRLPVINDLKTRGVIGENNQGYLEFRTGQKEKQDVVEAENTDRRAVYEAIAQKTGATADVVGRRRAIQIVQNAGTGEWLQDDKGNWYQK